jgi:hypothetical protein
MKSSSLTKISGEIWHNVNQKGLGGPVKASGKARALNEGS